MGHANHFELLKDLLRNQPHFSVLDIGTGTGQSALHLTEYFNRVIGIDIEEAAILAGRQQLFESRKIIKLKVMDAAVLRFPAQHFDGVTSFMSLHHLRLIDRVLSEAYRVLRPEGIFFAVDHLDRTGNPKQNNYLNLHKLKIEVDYKLGKNHFPLISPEAMKERLNEIGFKEIGFELFLKHSEASSNHEVLNQRIMEMVNQVRKTIEQLGSKKEAFEKRLKEIEKQLLKMGVERPPYYAVYGFKPEEK